jgi:protein-disulfide isomerase
MIGRKMRSLKIATLLATLALPAFATDLQNLSDAERAIFRDEVRAYLMENPEVMLEAMQGLRDRESQSEAKADEQLLVDMQDEIFQDGVSFVGGNPDGDVTIVEFLDYRCGYCRKAHADMAQLLKIDGNIRWVVKEFPILGPDSDAASKLAVATLKHYGNDAYYRLHDVLMTFNGPVNDSTYAAIALKAGFELEPLLDLVKSNDVSDHIERMHILGQTLKISGTPAFVIEDTILRGYLPLADMQQIVAEVRSK